MQVYPHQSLTTFQDSICSCKNVIEPCMYSESNFLPECPGNDSLECRGTITVPLLQNIGYIGTPGSCKCCQWHTICFHTDLFICICHIDLDQYVFQVSESMIK